MGLARQVQDAMQRQQQLEAQRRAAAVILARYGQVRAVSRWAQCVLCSDEPRPYHLAFRIAER